MCQSNSGPPTCASRATSYASARATDEASPTSRMRSRCCVRNASESVTFTIDMLVEAVHRIFEARALGVGDASVPDGIDVDASREEAEAAAERAQRCSPGRGRLLDAGRVEHRSHDLPAEPHIAALHVLLGGEPLEGAHARIADGVAERAAGVEVAARGFGRTSVVRVRGSRPLEQERPVDAAPAELDGPLVQLGGATEGERRSSVLGGSVGARGGARGLAGAVPVDVERVSVVGRMTLERLGERAMDSDALGSGEEALRRLGDLVVVRRDRLACSRQALAQQERIAQTRARRCGPRV